ncbi:MAG: hypothetical protein SVV67_03480 [Bacillota bacterium]|nr:hypothetical protein [Bacillota bacterium]
MLTRSRIMLLLIAVALFLPLLSGCSLLIPFRSETDKAEEPLAETFEVVITEMEPADDFTDEHTAVNEEVAEEVVVPSDKSDRLPGSLNWDSIALYASGKDFYREGGLKTEGFTGKKTKTEQPDVTAEAETAAEDPTIYVTTEEDTADWGVPIIEDGDDDDDDDDDDGDWYNLD